MKQQIAELSKEFYVLLQENYFLHYNARYPSMNLVPSTLHDDVALFGHFHQYSTVFVPKIDRQFELYTGQHWLTLTVSLTVKYLFFYLRLPGMF